VSDDGSARFEDDESDDGNGVDPTVIEAGNFAFEDEEIAALFDRRPELAIGILVFLSAMVYAGIQLVMDGRVNLVETAIFAIVFGLVWVFFRDYFGE